MPLKVKNIHKNYKYDYNEFRFFNKTKSKIYSSLLNYKFI